jgi:alpha-tubulin suppressor-like RCC1 family protein
MGCQLPKPIESLQGVKVDAVAANQKHTLALMEDGSVYAWGDEEVYLENEWVVSVAASGALGLGSSAGYTWGLVSAPLRVNALRVACGL